MAKKTAVLTGASSGLGMEFARTVHAVFPEIEELWLIARRADKLEEAAGKAGIPCRIVSADLTGDGVGELRDLFDGEKPDVALLINCAGCGYLGNVAELDGELMSRCIDLNVRALTAVTRAALPYMGRGGHIINISSIASFCPNPRMTVYSASKSYVSAFSRGLGDELRGDGISVTAVCPGPMATEFLDVGGIAGNSKMFKTLPYNDAASVAEGALRAAKRGRSVYTPGAFYKFYRFIAKIVPHAILVKAART